MGKYKAVDKIVAELIRLDCLPSLADELAWRSVLQRRELIFLLELGRMMNEIPAPYKEKIQA